LEDYREEGRSTMRSLIETSKHVHNREQLVEKSTDFKRLFDSLVSLSIAAHEHSLSHSPIAPLPLYPEDHLLSEALRQELERLCSIDGGRELIERMQEEALHRLDKYLKRKSIPSQPPSKKQEMG